jgi:hypothetical protein
MAVSLLTSRPGGLALKALPAHARALDQYRR